MLARSFEQSHPWEVVVADRAVVLSECHWQWQDRHWLLCLVSAQGIAECIYYTQRGVTDFVPSSAHETKTIPRWMLFLHLPKAKKAAYLILPGIGSGKRRLLISHLFLHKRS